jgi:hypothetical protein
MMMNAPEVKMMMFRHRRPATTRLLLLRKISDKTATATSLRFVSTTTTRTANANNGTSTTTTACDVTVTPGSDDDHDQGDQDDGTTDTKPKLNCLFLSNVYPDASASAAGTRTRSLMKLLSQQEDDDGGGRKVGFATTAKGDVNNDDDEEKVTTKLEFTSPSLLSKELLSDDAVQEFAHLPANRSDLARDFFQNHNHIDTVVFDRFYMEEAFSFVVQEHLPDATLVLDMQDMHSLRWGRQEIVRHFDDYSTNNNNKIHHGNQNNNNNNADPFECLEEVLNYTPSLEDHHGNSYSSSYLSKKNTKKKNPPHILRELASIHRSDLTLVCSPYELDLLQSVYQVPSDKLCLASFFVNPSSAEMKSKRRMQPPFTDDDDDDDDTTRFVFCGGFRHAPNKDAVLLLIRHIWPSIRARLKGKNAKLHIYGAYCTQEIYQHHSPVEHGIVVHGYTPSLGDVFSGGILLAPLRFGAGIKGKIVDAWTFGMPVVTTPIGSEGMMLSCNDDNNNNNNNEQLLFGGKIASTLQDFVDSAVELAVDKGAARQARDTGKRLLFELYDEQQNWIPLQDTLRRVQQTLPDRRRTDFTRAMLWHQSNRSTEYFSRWIEIKESCLERNHQQNDPKDV